MAWTDDRVELLKKLWAEGLSASQIARELGEVTRNAVIGKVHRLGLSGRTTKTRVDRPRTRRHPRPPRKAILPIVEKVEPLLTTRNSNGEIEGVKYDRVGVVLVNAVNKQQLQIEAQKETIKRRQEQIEKQRNELEAIKRLVCLQNANAEICKSEN